jgi:hypothetical protein
VGQTACVSDRIGNTGAVWNADEPGVAHRPGDVNDEWRRGRGRAGRRRWPERCHLERSGHRRMRVMMAPHDQQHDEADEPDRKRSALLHGERGQVHAETVPAIW